MTSFVFVHPDTEIEGLWDQFRTSIRTPDGRKEIRLDAQIRYTPPHKVDEIRGPFLETVGTGAEANQIVPEHQNRPLAAAFADHYIQALGSDEDKEHPHGFIAVLCGKCGNADRNAYPHADEYGLTKCHCHEPEPRNTPWPMKAAWKFLLMKTLPGFQEFVATTAKQAGAPQQAEAETAATEEEHLEPAPGS